MLLSVIKAELYKLRRAPVWIAFFILPLLAGVMGTFNYIQNIGILKKEWYSLWTQHTLFSSFFFLPSLIGILCAYEWRLEHRENNWNRLMTQPVPILSVYCGKLIVSAGLVVLTLAWTGTLYLISGGYTGFIAAPPPELALWLLLGCLGGVAIAAVQLLLSMIIKSFAIPVAISLVGGIVGLLAANYGYGLCFPYALLAMGMDANGKGFLQLGQTAQYILSCALCIAASTLLAVWFLRKRDVRTD